MMTLTIREGRRIREWLTEHLPQASYATLHQRVGRRRCSYQSTERLLKRLELADMAPDPEAVMRWVGRTMHAHRLVGEQRLRLRVYGGGRCLRAFSLSASITADAVEVPHRCPGGCRHAA